MARALIDTILMDVLTCGLLIHCFMRDDHVCSRAALPLAAAVRATRGRHGGRSLCHTSYSAESASLENWVCGTGSPYRRGGGCHAAPPRTDPVPPRHPPRDRDPNSDRRVRGTVSKPTYISRTKLKKRLLLSL